MTGVCWSISFPRSIMVCYCPLSVLSVPESILNEGQLHLAAIFQLSPRYHGDLLVFWWTWLWAEGCVHKGGGSKRRRVVGAKDGEKQWRNTSKGRAGPLHPSKHHKGSHFKHPVNMQKGRRPSICAVLWLWQAPAITPLSLCPSPFPTPSVQ